MSPLIVSGRPSRARPSPQRERLLALIRDDPWLTVGELLEQSELSWGTLHYHVTLLIRSGAIRSVREGRRRLLVATAPGQEGRTPSAPLIRGKTVREIAEMIAESPGSTIEGITERTDRSPRVVYYHVKRLIDADLVVSTSPTRHRNLSPTPRLLALLSRRTGPKP